ncbi:hypothetical protein NA57DRAFT_82102 [Rhizodiscina lignyota]|uniref:Uncharacterized protein n=1 Tax=Rhizodiscina lignyota TaxID=1504668 RepID=A0A9P4M0W1_9PEZI|nr:hypothetical protein NA57DRAFT_82102 [Rhizodiscina lignyota]
MAATSTRSARRSNASHFHFDASLLTDLHNSSSFLASDLEKRWIQSDRVASHLRDWYNACLKDEGHGGWVKELLSQARTDLHEHQFTRFIDTVVSYITDPEHSEDQLVASQDPEPDSPAVDINFFVQMWGLTADTIIHEPANADSVSPFAQYLSSRPDWCYRTAVKLLVCAFEDVNKNPSGYFATLLNDPDADPAAGCKRCEKSEGPQLPAPKRATAVREAATEAAPIAAQDAPPGAPTEEDEEAEDEMTR